jgi:hypothetical protein
VTGITTDLLLQYGALGIMVVYMMYDKQVIMKELISTLQSMRQEVNDLRMDIQTSRRGRK